MQRARKKTKDHPKKSLHYTIEIQEWDRRKGKKEKKKKANSDFLYQVIMGIRGSKVKL